MNSPPYRGRFAPSPTGPLHFGSLVAAISSYAQAKQHQGKWLVRIEDVDLPRCDRKSTNLILKALEAYGMHWDEEILYQSQRTNIYQAALDELTTRNMCYHCTCSRKQIKQNSAPDNNIAIYPGTCRNGIAKGKRDRSTRLRSNNITIRFKDKIQGEFSQNIASDVGDFIIKRADNLFAYQLAVVIDDYEQNITEVVRGSDMLDSTPRQIFLQQCLGYSSPRYIHTPLAINPDGSKLSKQTKALAIDLNDPRTNLIKALDFLCQQPPHELRETDVDTIWTWAIQNWSVHAIPAVLGITYNEDNERTTSI